MAGTLRPPFANKTKLRGIYTLLLILSVRIERIESRRAPWILGPIRSSTRFQHHTKNDKQHRLTAPFTLLLRGGSSSTKESKERAYRLQQQLHLQTRGIQLREALIDRGFLELQHYDNSAGAPRGKDVDWDCVLSTAENPKPCMYTLDAEEGTKVMCPIGTQDYITVVALNRLRRVDPSKVNPLWHDQYNILKNWFGEGSQYSVYQHLPQAFAVGISGLLDRPLWLQTVFGVAILFSVIITLPLWRIVGPQLLQTPLLWQTWSHWGRFIHAPLPLKLFLGQLAFYYVGSAVKTVYGNIFNLLVEWECSALEKHLPLTILEEDEDE